MRLQSQVCNQIAVGALKLPRMRSGFLSERKEYVIEFDLYPLQTTGARAGPNESLRHNVSGALGTFIERL